MKREIKKIINLPEGVKVSITGNNFMIHGPLGETKAKINFKKNIKVEVKGNQIEIYCAKATKREKKIIGTIKGKLDSMISGSEKEYTYKLQICSVHFPMTVKIEHGKFVIKNFLGENKDRIVAIPKGAEVKIEGDMVIVTSIDKEKAGEAASAIEMITKIKRYDRRVFQDGIWITHKEKGRR